MFLIKSPRRPHIQITDWPSNPCNQLSRSSAQAEKVEWTRETAALVGKLENRPNQIKVARTRHHEQPFEGREEAAEERGRREKGR